MRNIETMPVNQALADPEAGANTPHNDRYREVLQLGWLATTERADFGNFRRHFQKDSWIIPTQDEGAGSTTIRARHERVITLCDADEGVTLEADVAEVVLIGTDPTRVRSFLLKTDQKDPYSGHFVRWLHIFRAPTE